MQGGILFPTRPSSLSSRQFLLLLCNVLAGGAGGTLHIRSNRISEWVGCVILVTLEGSNPPVAVALGHGTEKQTSGCHRFPKGAAEADSHGGQGLFCEGQCVTGGTDEQGELSHAGIFPGHSKNTIFLLDSCFLGGRGRTLPSSGSDVIFLC